jgi:amino acid transporter
MWLFCIVFSLLVGYIAYRGVNGSTAVNMGINIIQISALVVFAVMAIAYRSNHPQGSVGWHLSNGTPVNYNVDQVNVTDDKNQPVQDTWADSSSKYQVDDKGVVINSKDANGVEIKDKDGKPVPLAAIKQ